MPAVDRAHAPARAGARALSLALALSLAHASGCATGPYPLGGPLPAPPPDLPAAIHLKTPTESFTHAWEVALRAGRLWVRPRPGPSIASAEPWRLLPPDGLPYNDARDVEGPIPTLRELSADGENLVVLGEDGLVYYMKLYDWGWITNWGLPMGDPLWREGPHRALVISHRGPLAARYEDIDGNEFPISAGVTTLYALSEDGRSLHYADPWLNGGFARRIALPCRDRLIARGLSASASTLAVIDLAGRVFTRLADYDTLGNNPVLAYTWERGVHDERTLPPEGWVEQPPVPGRITARLTIFQTGAGNAARTLRVEGVDASGAGGYWEKALRERAWTFVPTGSAVAGPFLANAANPGAVARPDEVLGPSVERDLDGVSESPPLDAEVRLALRAWNPACSPAFLRLARGEAALDLPLYTIDPDQDEAGRVTGLEGAVILPAERPSALDPLVRALFGDGGYCEVDISIAEDAVVIEGDAPGLWTGFRFVFR